MSEKKYYAVGALTPEGWERVHSILTQDGTLEDNIPSRPVECADLKEHSPTRAVYLLDDEEAAQLSQHSDIRFIHLDQSKYPELSPPRPDDLHSGARYTTPVKNHRDFLAGGYPNPTTTADINRTGYQVLRGATYENPWATASSVINSTVPLPTGSGTGKDIDVIVGDEGCWFGHVEFANNTGNGPADYIGGNPLPGNGTCDLLDVVLDGPYYIDPDWFDANPGLRLMTRWDGTTVPTETAARDWWGNANLRSPEFASAGTVSIPSYYTRANCNGSNTARSAEGTHGTPCAGQTYGRTHGWAYNANKWFIDAYGYYGLWPVDNYFDVMKIFHQTKPVNPTHGNKNPTITSNSWGYREGQGYSGYYYFRQGPSGSGGVAYSTKPQFMYQLGSAGDGGRFKGEMMVNNLTVAGDELIASGVIFVAAAGNSNQQQVTSDHPNYNNYWSSSPNTPLSSAYHLSLDGVNYCYNTTNRRGFPQQIGKYTTGTTVVYPVINIGALDDSYQLDGKERKVNYSDMGNDIDCYTPGDGTLTSNWGAGLLIPRHDQRVGGLTSYDCGFSGTSSACPTATGMIATILENNRTWTWQDVRNWLHALDEQPLSDFYQGVEPTTPTDTAWYDLNSLQGSARRVLYNNIAPVVVYTLTTTLAVPSVSIYVNQSLIPVTPVTASGGTGTLVWSVSPTLPAGLLLNSSSGQLTGTPTALHSTSSFAVTVTDQSTPTPQTSSKSFSISVKPQPIVISLSTTTKAVYAYTEVTPFTPATASGGYGTKTWAISPTLPASLSFNTTSGEITGTPTVLSTSRSYTITVTDQASQSKTASIAIASVALPMTPFVNVPDAQLFVYEPIPAFTPVVVTGGSGVKTWSVTPALPTGLTINPTNGEISGTPTVVSSATYTIRITDQVSQQVSRPITLSTLVRPLTAIKQTGGKVSSFVINKPIVPFIPVSSLGGSGTKTWSIGLDNPSNLRFSTPTGLPTGLTFNTSNGIISGTPTEAGVNGYTVTVSDQIGQTSSEDFFLRVRSPQDIILSDDQNIVYGTLFDLLGTTATGYGAVLLGNPVDPGQVVKPADWNKIEEDVIRCIVHQNGTSTFITHQEGTSDFNLLRATTATIVDDNVRDRLYTSIQYLYATSGTVALNQLEYSRVNTYEESPGEWVSHWTEIPKSSNGYMSSVSYTWFYPIHLNYYFNLGGSIKPEFEIDGPDAPSWAPMVALMNQIVFGKAEFYQALLNPGSSKTFTRVFAAGTSPGPTSKAIILTFNVLGRQLLVTANFVAGYHIKGKKGKKKWWKKKKWFGKKKGKFGKKKGYWGKKKGFYYGPDPYNVTVKMRVKSEYLSSYSVNKNGGLAAPIPQSQLMTNSLSATPAPIPIFNCGSGQPSQTRTIQLRNNTSATCIVSHMMLRGYTTGTLSTRTLTIPAYDSRTFDLTYTGAGPGYYRGDVYIMSNIFRPIALFTEINVGSVSPPSLTMTTTTNELIVQDFLVDFAGGNYRDFSVTLPTTPGFTLYSRIPDDGNPITPEYEGFRVTFNPHGLPNVLHSATAVVTIYPLDTSLDNTIINVPIRITSNIQYSTLGTWMSAQGPDNNVAGLSYAIIGGVKYLTIGLGSVPSYADGGVPSVNQLSSEDNFTSWAEIYRIPITGDARTYYSGNYSIKTSDFYEGNSIGYQFGVGNAKGSICTVKDDGHGNLEITWNTARTVASDPSIARTLKGLANAPYYYDETVERENQLEYNYDLIDYTYTHYFVGFARTGGVATRLVIPNLNSNSI